jgi:hypothetical protein
MEKRHKEGPGISTGLAETGNPFARNKSSAAAVLSPQLFQLSPSLLSSPESDVVLRFAFFFLPF